MKLTKQELLATIAEIAKWEWDEYNNRYKITGPDGSGWVMIYATPDQLLSPEYIWIAHQIVKDALADESLQKKELFNWNLNLEVQYAPPKRAAGMAVSEVKYLVHVSATCENYYRALIKTMKP